MKKNGNLFVAMFLFLFFGVIFYIWQKNEKLNSAYRINRLEAGIKEIKTKNNLLRVEINKCVSMARLEEASDKYGMTRTAPGNIVHVKFER